MNLSKIFVGLVLQFVPDFSDVRGPCHPGNLCIQQET